jgi:hypothetical protein
MSSAIQKMDHELHLIVVKKICKLDKNTSFAVGMAGQ